VDLKKDFNAKYDFSRIQQFKTLLVFFNLNGKFTTKSWNQFCIKKMVVIKFQTMEKH
jgi:hypothetical protein